MSLLCRSTKQRVLCVNSNAAVHSSNVLDMLLYVFAVHCSLL